MTNKFKRKGAGLREMFQKNNKIVPRTDWSNHHLSSPYLQSGTHYKPIPKINKTVKISTKDFTTAFNTRAATVVPTNKRTFFFSAPYSSSKSQQNCLNSSLHMPTSLAPQSSYDNSPIDSPRSDKRYGKGIKIGLTKKYKNIRR